ncbi:MAG: SDR family oxidoreductase [Hyphomicrobiales bacterium]|nr:SDR family oxidoreductase [Hyphomicrobiales bacterium]
MSQAMTAPGAPLAGLHAFVTGAGSGIGAATARALALAGARVSLAGRRPGPLKETAAALGGQAGVVAEMDITDEKAVAAGLAAAVRAHGAIDILVNNAGQAASAAFDRVDRAQWDAMLTVNLTGAFLVTRAVLPEMAKRGRGRVIMIASTAGLTGYAYVAPYVAAKHGVIGLTRALAHEYARSGVTINAVCPGFTDTPLVDRSVETITAKTGRTADEARAALAKGNPQGRLVRPEEVADAVVWLASPAAAAINGQAIAVAGGEVMTG